MVLFAVSEIAKLHEHWIFIPDTNSLCASYPIKLRHRGSKKGEIPYILVRLAALRCLVYQSA